MALGSMTLGSMTLGSTHLASKCPLDQLSIISGSQFVPLTLEGFIFANLWLLIVLGKTY